MGASMEIIDTRGMTPLSTASWSGSLSVVQWLLKQKMPSHHFSVKGSPWMTSACGGHGPFTAQTWAERKQKVYSIVQYNTVQYSKF